MLTQTQAIIQANKDTARRLAAAVRRTDKVAISAAAARDLLARSMGAANWAEFARTGPVSAT